MSWQDPAAVRALEQLDAPWHAQTWADFRDTSPEEQRWLVEGLLPAGMLAFVAAPPKKGKTWVGIGLALAVAAGVPYLGRFKIPEPRPVLYAALEGSRAGLRARIGALARGYGLDPDGDDLRRLHVLYRPRPFDLIEAATSEWLHHEAAELDAGLIFVDVLRAAARFRENDAGDFQLVREGLEPLLVADRTVALLHHFGKLTDTQKERSPGERMAGTGAMYGALDVGLLITSSSDGARRMAVDVEARDFAAPDRLGLVIEGTGSAEHGGFNYGDTATLTYDEAATEEPDLVAELELHFADAPEWRTLDELRADLGRNKDELRVVLEHGDNRFVRVAGDRVGRHRNARPWGTHAMLAELTPTAEASTEQTELVWLETPSQTSQTPSASDTGRASGSLALPPGERGRARHTDAFVRSGSEPDETRPEEDRWDNQF